MSSGFDYEGLYKRTFANKYYSRHPITEFSYRYAARHIGTTSHLLDIGSGRGVFLKLVRQLFPKARITSVDIHKFHEIAGVEFIRLNLAEEWLPKAEIVTGLDVLEHIHPHDVLHVLESIAKAAPRAIFQIPNGGDKPYGEQLHLIQAEPAWWTETMEPFFKNIVVDDLGAGHFGYRVLSKLYEDTDDSGHQA